MTSLFPNPWLSSGLMHYAMFFLSLFSSCSDLLFFYFYFDFTKKIPIQLI